MKGIKKKIEQQQLNSLTQWAHSVRRTSRHCWLKSNSSASKVWTHMSVRHQQSTALQWLHLLPFPPWLIATISLNGMQCRHQPLDRINNICASLFASITFVFILLLKICPHRWYDEDRNISHINKEREREGDACRGVLHIDHKRRYDDCVIISGCKKKKEIRPCACGHWQTSG
jgi:hypothetical protein